MVDGERYHACSFHITSALRGQGCAVILDHALNGNPYPAREPKLSDEQEAYLIALACSEAPEGYARWTIEMLAERMVADGKIDTISPSKVQMILKKTN